MTNWTKIKRLTAPTVPAISVAEAKLHLNVSDDDAYIAMLVEAAIAHVDSPTGAGLALITQTYRQTIDPNETQIDLPITPVQAIEGVTIGGEPVGFIADINRTPARLTISAQSKGGFVEYTAGYGDAPTDVPADLRAALLLIVGHLYANREAVTDRQMYEIPMGVAAILRRYAL